MPTWSPLAGNVMRERFASLLGSAVILVTGAAGCSPGPSAAPPPGPRAGPPATKHLYPAKAGPKWGYIDAQGKMVIAPQFDFATRFSEGLALVMKGDAWSCIDTTGAVQFQTPCSADLMGYSDGFARGSIGLGFHYFDRQGRLLPQRFAGTQEFSEGLAAVCIDPERFKPQRELFRAPTGKWGFIDTTGELVIPARYWAVGRFSHGLAPVYVGGINRQCTGLDGGKWGYIDRKGNLVIPPRFDFARPFSEAVACVRLLQKGKDGVEHLHAYIGPDGGYVIEPRRYFCANDFHEGLAAVRSTTPDLPLWEQNFGFIDKQGHVAIPSRFSQVGDFSEGLAAAQEKPTWDENAKTWIPGGQGYIDKRGAWVVPSQYYWAGEFVGGLASVGILNEGHGYIDRHGRRVAWWGQ
jgi:hypothetical protein